MNECHILYANEEIYCPFPFLSLVVHQPAIINEPSFGGGQVFHFVHEMAARFFAFLHQADCHKSFTQTGPNFRV